MLVDDKQAREKNGLFATDADRYENNARCAAYGCEETNQLQWKWRNPETLPEKFDIAEAEAAILDAFIRQGGAHVWRGDGSSCAAQIVETVWKRVESLSAQVAEHQKNHAEAFRLALFHQKRAEAAEAQVAELRGWKQQIIDLIRAMDMQSKQVVQGDGSVIGYQWNTGLWHRFMGIAGGAVPLTPEQAQTLEEFREAVQRDVIDPIVNRNRELMYGECPRCGRANGAGHVC